MKTMLIPVDFTSVTDNSVLFAASWAGMNAYTHIILLYSFYNLADQIVFSAEYTHFGGDKLIEEREDIIEKADLLTEKIKAVESNLTVVKSFSELPLIRSILDVVQNNDVALIVAGSDNAHASGSESIIAQQVISIAKISPVRVLVVPAGYTFRPISNALVPFDLNALNTLDKLRHLKASPFWDKVRLLALNVSSGKADVPGTDLQAQADEALHKYFEGFNHEVFSVKETNVIKGITTFTEYHDVQLIIALPGKHSFLYNLTHRSISEAIYRNVRVPVLILK